MMEQFTGVYHNDELRLRLTPLGACLDHMRRGRIQARWRVDGDRLDITTAADRYTLRIGDRGSLVGEVESTGDDLEPVVHVIELRRVRDVSPDRTSPPRRGPDGWAIVGTPPKLRRGPDRWALDSPPHAAPWPTDRPERPDGRPDTPRPCGHAPELSSTLSGILERLALLERALADVLDRMTQLEHRC